MGNDAMSQSAASSVVDLFPGTMCGAPRVSLAWWGMNDWLFLTKQQPEMQERTEDGALPCTSLAAPERFAFSIQRRSEYPSWLVEYS